MLTDQAIRRVRAYARAKGLSPSGLAKAGGLSKNACSGMDRDGWSPRVSTLRKLEALIPEGFDEAPGVRDQP